MTIHKNDTDMKKEYMTPEVAVMKMETGSMIAQSMNFSDGTGKGSIFNSDALYDAETNRNGGFDIWDVD